ncbi:M28 family peptidase [bacterium]|nr:MAG: M28 family peptidase [bacterium]
MKSLYISSLLVLGACSSYTSNFSPDITSEDIKAHISYLASDSLKGRDTGSLGEALASHYIIERFKEAQLEPLGTEGRFIQEFDVVKGYEEGPTGSSILTEHESFSSDTDSILAWAGAATASAKGKLVIAGYGINAPDLKYNDINPKIKGNVVLIMRFGPEGDSNPHTAFGFHWSLDKKVKNLIEAGAIGVIISEAPLYTTEGLNMDYKRGKARTSIPVVQVSAEIGAKLAKDYAGVDLEAYQKDINKNKKSVFKASSKEIEIKTDVQERTVIAKNIAGIIKGKKEGLGAIVVGAHYDHLGMGGSNSLSGSKTPQIHNGADDNASGTAGVLELADYFSEHRMDHDLIFLTFSGEEMGLLGSDFFVNNPTYPLENMRAMINMDMIGRLNNRNLLIFGTGSANAWDSLITKANTDQLEIKQVPDGTGASDHTSFYNKNVSVLHYFTDTHSDYHRPSDDTEFINTMGEKMVLDHVARVIEDLDTKTTEEFYFTEAPVTQKRSVTMSGTTLGVLPDYGYRGEGMRITGTSEGRPGEKAGLKNGDVIVQLGSKKLKDIYDYMDALNQFKKGDTSTVHILRDGKAMELSVQF